MLSCYNVSRETSALLWLCCLQVVSNQGNVITLAGAESMGEFLITKGALCSNKGSMKTRKPLSLLHSAFQIPAMRLFQP